MHEQQQQHEQQQLQPQTALVLLCVISFISCKAIVQMCAWQAVSGTMDLPAGS